MADNEIYEIISAFVLGCMDKEDYNRFKNYHDNQGSLPLKIFGEFQNIVALIPTMMEISYPDSKLKDAVAKNILSYQEEIKTKIRAKKTATFSPTQTIAETKSVVETNKIPTQPKEKVEQIHEEHKQTKDIPPQIATKTELTNKHAHRKENTENYEKLVADLLPKGKKHKIKKQLTLETAQNTVESQTSRTSRLPWIIFLMILVITIFASIYFFNKNDNLEKDAAKLNREILSLKAELRKETKYVNSHKKIVDFLNYNELDIINLQRRDNSLDASGKLLISFNKKEALLDAENLPELSEGKVFQLWLITKDISYSLLKFIPVQGSKYYTMPKLPYVPKSEVDLIRITVEPDSGSEYPTGNTILFGGFSR